MERLGAIIAGMQTATSGISPDEHIRMLIDGVKRQVNEYNSAFGTEHLEDGYDCPLCKNRGDHAYADGVYLRIEPCSCDKVRRSIRRMKRSGLADVIGLYTFGKYQATEPWQKTVKAAAQHYVDDSDAAWFFIGGASGSGKSHICTAICRELMRANEVHYCLWEEEIPELKALALDAERRAAKLERLKTVDVLYIDDFLRNPDSSNRPSYADTSLAREILNRRYISRKRTIISSEWYSHEILDMSAAIGGRIIERCGRYCINIKREAGKNYRLRIGGTMV